MGSELVFEGKKYISARRAAEISGYNSDYIGQLCRKGALECRLVGRSWFMTEDSIVGHKVVASRAPRGRIASIGRAEDVTIGPRATAGGIRGDGSSIPAISYIPTAVPEQSDAVAISTLSFRPTQHSSNVSSHENASDNSRFTRRIVAVTLVVLLLVVVAPYFSTRLSSNHGLSFFSRDRSVVVSDVGTQVSPYLASLSISISNFWESATSENTLFDTIRNRMGMLAIGVYDGVRSIPELIFNTAHNMRRLVVGDFVPVEENTAGKAFFGETSQERAGITVVPSTGDMERDERLKQYIRDSFSVETSVIPDTSGDSGLIRPVFRKQSEQDYLYVIVPVKDAGE